MKIARFFSFNSFQIHFIISFHLARESGGIQPLDLGAGELVAVPGAKVGDGAVKEMLFTSPRPDAAALAGERLELVAVRAGLGQHSILIDAHGRAADGDHDVRPGEVEAGGALDTAIPFSM